METARFRLSIDDYVAYNQRLCARRVGRVLAVTIAVVAILLIAADGMNGFRAALWGAVAGFIIFAIYIFMVVPQSARAIYSEQASISEEKTLSVDDKAIEFRQHSGTFRIDWGNIVQWDESARLMTLFVNRLMFIPITKSEIGDEMTARIRNSLIQSGLSKPLRRRPAK